MFGPVRSLPTYRKLAAINYRVNQRSDAIATIFSGPHSGAILDRRRSAMLISSRWLKFDGFDLRVLTFWVLFITDKAPELVRKRIASGSSTRHTMYRIESIARRFIGNHLGR